jgi:non-ribosomal peptide synthetase-like protein
MQFDDLRSGAEFEKRLKAKNRANLGAALLWLLTRWLFTFLALGFALVSLAVDSGAFRAVAFALAALGTLLIGAFYAVLVERLTLGFRKLEPKYVSIYDPYYWRHERYWKVADFATLLSAFNGTPFKALAWRAVGVKVGKRLFDDGASLSERTLVEFGDDVTLGDSCTLQAHTMEDATFKSDRIRVGSGVTIGSNTYVNYGVEMGDGSALAGAFLMKGTMVPAGSVWGGNPARQISA